MADVRFSQATNAYSDALRAAERIIAKAGAGDTEESSSTAATGSSSFLDMVGHALKGAESMGFKSEEVSSRAIAGKAGLADVITAVSSAENALDTVVAVRDKVISAYQEIMRMTI